jgi:hypothetical protein
MGTLECFMKHGIVHGLCVGRGDAEGSDPCKPTTVISCFGSVYTRHATRGCGFDDVVACARFDLCAEGRQTTASEERRRTSWERKSGGREVAVCLRVDGGRISKPDGACSASRLFARCGRGVRPARCLPAEVLKHAIRRGRVVGWAVIVGVYVFRSAGAKAEGEDHASGLRSSPNSKDLRFASNVASRSHNDAMRRAHFAVTPSSFATAVTSDAASPSSAPSAMAVETAS